MPRHVRPAAGNEGVERRLVTQAMRLAETALDLFHGRRQQLAYQNLLTHTIRLEASDTPTARPTAVSSARQTLGHRVIEQGRNTEAAREALQAGGPVDDRTEDADFELVLRTDAPSDGRPVSDAQ